MSSARHFEELVCWQRIHQLKTEVSKVIEHGPAGDDAAFRGEIVNAADRAEHHIEEGFGRYKPRVFAAFLEFSRTAGGETRSLLRQGFARGYFSAEQFDQLDKLAAQALQAIVSFQRYLRSPAAAKAHYTWRYQRPYTARVARAENDPNGPNDPNGSNVLTAERSGT